MERQRSPESREIGPEQREFPLRSNLDDDFIQVSGRDMFSRADWRHALRQYLTGVREDIGSIMYRPKITFGGIGLNTHADRAYYWVQGTPSAEVPKLLESSVLRVGQSREDVEHALEQLLENESVEMLVITLPNRNSDAPRPTAELKLWRQPNGIGVRFD